jgi:hypothetical protein
VVEVADGPVDGVVDGAAGTAGSALLVAPRFGGAVAVATTDKSMSSTSDQAEAESTTAGVLGAHAAAAGAATSVARA